MTPAFWQGKKVFVTGHTGFKGTWLSLWLNHLGAQVTGYALPPPTQPSLFALTGLSNMVNHIEGDIRDLDMLSTSMQLAAPDIVIHLAAQSLVRPSYQTPVDTYATNVMGTVHVLEAIRHTPSIKAAIMVTSDKCYQNREQMAGYREEDPMGGDDPYSNSKGCAELVTHAYRASFMGADHAPAIASARAGNVIGGGDWAQDRLIPDIIQSLINQRPVTLRYPNAIRPWQHVLEPLSGYLLLAERLCNAGARYARAWNFGPNDEDALTVEWITQALFKAWGSPVSFGVENPHVHEASILKLDCHQSRNQLHWRPQWNALTAIEQVSHWYKAYQAGEDMLAFTRQQIVQYQASLNHQASSDTDFHQSAC